MHLDRGDGVTLAYAHTAGRSPTAVFLPGFMSDMTGDKALAVASWCAAHGHGCLRLDYSGHGSSGGRFEDGTIGRWTQDALAVIDHAVAGPIVLVGSSMGGWIALNVALARPERVVGLVGVAAAPDFTELLMWPAFSAAQREAILTHGVLRLPSQYGGEQIISRALIEDGRLHLRLGGTIALHCPVRLLHGQRDPDVPWQISLQLAAQLAGDDVRVILVKDGNHRLSRPADIDLLCETVGALLQQDRGEALPVAGITPG
jgi:pimeloyl-ACP methyl ester carboxylesterase